MALVGVSYIRSSAQRQPDSGAAGTRTLHVLWTVHVGGDSQKMAANDPACAGAGYQRFGFERDLAGLEELQRESERHTDSTGGRPKMHISPAGEFFETELDSTYGNRAFRKFDWLALGHEVGIQGHAITFSGTPYCWPRRPETPDGIARELVDAHTFAERWLHLGRKVNLGLGKVEVN